MLESKITFYDWLESQLKEKTKFKWFPTEKLLKIGHSSQLIGN